ncbi:MAG: PH domain-containing protein [Chloroflexi bacterium]|nr:PH domain-containing protein [Chloroflexota bacterium]
MNDAFTFYPPRRGGNIFHLSAIIALTLGGVWGLYETAYAADIGPVFLSYLFPALLAIPLVPLLVYRLYTLQRSVYILERDNIRLQWGLRVEIIPTNDILWVRPDSDLISSLRLPWLRWPGAVLGMRRVAGGIPVEFLASRGRNLILIATSDRIFAVSPNDPSAFLQAYQRLTELGSLYPPQPQSVQPTFLLARIWKTRPVRYLILTSVLLSLGLLVWVSLVIPALGQISLGFTASGAPRAPILGIQLMLLPVLNTIFLFINLFLGLFFYRQDESQILAYLLWGNSVFVAALFLGAVYFILRSAA